MDPTTDDQIMTRVRDGEVGQLGVLFERHHVPLYNFFLRQVRDRATSEDLVQEVFLRMLRYRHTYRGAGQFGVWMYQIARNARTDHYRKHRREAQMPEDGIDVADASPSSSDRLAVDQTHALLHAALERLPEDKREVLVLSRFQDLRYEQIGALLGCSEGAVKVRVHRAMKELRTQYAKLAKDRV